MRVLWLARTLPFPLTAGDRIYTAKLAAALAGTGAAVTFAGLEGEAPPASIPNLHWHPVPGEPGGALAALASPMPLVAARHATPAYRAAVAALAADGVWDAVVVDQYGMGWVLGQRTSFAGRPRFVFVTHDHEESVTGLQWRDRGAGLPQRAYLLQNHLKTRWFERRTARACDLVTTITEEDAVAFRTVAPGTPALTLLPGYDGPRLPDRAPAADRAVVMFGSYRWSAKQANLRLFLDAADPILAAAGIEVRVVGDMPEDLRRALDGRYRATRFIGFVEDPMPYLTGARIAVLGEPIGGGFKMKLLEYVFHRLPVAALGCCTTGLPQPVRAHMLLRDAPEMLALAVAAAINDLPQLTTMQRGAFLAAADAFDWAERGEALRRAIGLTTPAPPAVLSAPGLPKRAI